MPDVDTKPDAEAPAGQEPTTPTKSEPTEPETKPEPTALSQEDWQKEAEKARKEAASYRTKLRAKEEAEEKAAEAKRQAELSAEERAKEAERRAEEAVQAAEARVLAAERRASLAGKVTNPDRVMRLMDDPSLYFDESGALNEKALLDAFPEYAPTTGPVAKAPAASAAGAAPKPITTREQIGKLTPAEYEAKRAEILAGMKR